MPLDRPHCIPAGRYDPDPDAAAGGGGVGRRRCHEIDPGDPEPTLRYVHGNETGGNQ